MNPEPGEIYREEVRCNHYYGGDLFVIVNAPDPIASSGAILKWEAYAAGGAEFKLDWDEMERLVVALKEALKHKPEWWA